MNLIFNYFVWLGISALLLTPFFVLFRLWKRKRRGGETVWKREFQLYVFFLCLLWLLTLTVIPEMHWENGTLSFETQRVHKTNWIPFLILWESGREAFLHHNFLYFFLNFFGNLWMFLPVGFFPPMLWHVSGKRTVLFGASLSVFIEISQLFLKRGTDVDDVLLNTLGTLLGCWLYFWGKKRKNRKNKTR